MSSTRLTNVAKANAELALKALLRNGISFIDSPLSDEEHVAMWNEMVPKQWRDIVQFMMDEECEVYEIFSNRVALHMQAPSGKFYKMRLTTASRDYKQQFMKRTTKNEKSQPQIRYVHNGEVAVVYGVLLTPDLTVQLLGQQKADALIEWAETCATMWKDVVESTETLQQLFAMIKTAGQLRRMVPELFRYMPKENQLAFEDQKRASTLPFEWAGYDRARVERLVGTLLKCQLLQGTTKPRMIAAMQQNNFSWASLLPDAERVQEEDADDTSEVESMVGDDDW